MGAALKFFLTLNLCLLFLFSGCGANNEEEAESAVQGAVSELTRGNCNAAISKIESVPFQSFNIRFVKTYASAYACRAGYSTTRLFIDDLGKIGAPSTLGGFTRFTTSAAMDEPRNDSYMDMLKAIDALLYAGGIPKDRNPTVERRRTRLGDEAGLRDLHAQLLYLSLSQIGKYLYFYGNSSTTGVKGSGGLGHNCLANYTMNIPINGGPGTIGTALDAAGAACDSGETGSLALGAQGDLNVERMCQGVVLFNNIVELLPVVLGDLTGDQLDDLSVYLTDIDTAINDFETTAGFSFVNILSQTECVSTFTTDDTNLQIVFAFIFEGLFQ